MLNIPQYCLVHHCLGQELHGFPKLLDHIPIYAPILLVFHPHLYLVLYYLYLGLYYTYLFLSILVFYLHHHHFDRCQTRVHSLYQFCILFHHHIHLIFHNHLGHILPYLYLENHLLSSDLFLHRRLSQHRSCHHCFLSLRLYHIVYQQCFHQHNPIVVSLYLCNQYLMECLLLVRSLVGRCILYYARYRL